MPYKNKETLYQKQREHRDRNKRLLREYLQTRRCVDCSVSDIRVLEFDHLPGFEKVKDVARMVTGSTYSWERILEEINKCEVVCANCHRIRTLIRLPIDSWRCA